MNEIIQPLIAIPTTDTQMLFVGLFEFILCTAFAYLIFHSCALFFYQRRFIKLVIITNILAWVGLVIIGLFVIPNELDGSYLDVYANLALANIGMMLLPISGCVVLLLSKPKIGIAVTLIFASIFAAIGGKGIGDLVSPKPMHAQIEWLSFNETDKHLSSLRMGLIDTQYQQSASTKLAKKLQHDGRLTNIGFSNHDEIKPPIRLDVIQAPYTDIVYLPEEYAFTNFGKKLFYGLLGLWAVIILTAFMMLLMVKSEPNDILKTD